MARAILLLVLPLLAACPSNPPYLAGPEVQAQVRALPGAAGGEVFGDASWHPFLRADHDRGSGYRGALVLGDDAILFVILDADLGRVDVAKRIRYADVEAVVLEGLGGTKLMVVRERSGAAHGFMFHGAVLVDAEAAIRAVDHARARLARARGLA